MKLRENKFKLIQGDREDAIYEPCVWRPAGKKCVPKIYEKQSRRQIIITVVTFFLNPFDAVVFF